MKKVILILILLLTTGMQFRVDDFNFNKKWSRKCNAIRRVPDGSGNFLFRNADNGKESVLLTDSDLNFAKMQMFNYKKVMHSDPTKRIRFPRKLNGNMRYTGRANGFRQHWRDPRLLEDLPKKRLVFRGIFQFGDDKIKLCFVLPRVKERND
jgi:hypothetical protein